MKRKITHTKMGTSDLGWLQSYFHFSFAEYFNPDNIHYGVLRVLNDDLIASGTGFDTHPHQNMEIISYVVDGNLTHADSMGHENTISRGQVQYMSAGTGVLHSEHNRGQDTTRSLQIWVLPDKKGHKPNYGDYPFEWKERINQFLHLVSTQEGAAPIKVHQDVNFYVTYLEKAQTLSFKIAPGRQVYLIDIEGDLNVSGEILQTRDALEASAEELIFQTTTDAHFMIIEMPLEP